MSSTFKYHEREYMINYYKQAGTNDYNYNTAILNLSILDGICYVDEEILYQLDEDQRTKYQMQSQDIKHMIEILGNPKRRQKYDAELAIQTQNNKILQDIKKYKPYQTSERNLRKYDDQIHHLIEISHTTSDIPNLRCSTSCYKQTNTKVCKSLHHSDSMQII
mgnify:FL=1